MKTRFFCFLALSALLLTALSACAPQAPAINVETAWGKPSGSVAGAGAFFMVIKNTGPAPDKLVSAKSSACGMTEVHNTVKADDGSMKMVLVTDGIEVPANGQLELKSGSYHIMCMKMQADQLTAGAKPTVNLVFEKSGEKVVSLEMRQQ
jgi:periplasmic copper chaperone A